MKRTSKKGFTLAELLIVIAIIAILIAILFPVFGAQLDKARLAADLANVRAKYSEIVADEMLKDVTFDGTANVTTDVTVYENELRAVVKYSTVTVDNPNHKVQVALNEAGGNASTDTAKIGSFTVDSDVTLSTGSRPTT